MAQEGAYVMVPDKLTGAQTTDIGKYVGATKAGKNGNRYVLGFNADSTSVPGYAAVGYATGTAYTTAYPYAYASASLPAGWQGVWATSVGSSELGWVLTYGTFTASIQSTDASNAPRGRAFVPNATAGSYNTAALTVAHSASWIRDAGVIGINVYSQAAASSGAQATSATLQLVPNAIHFSA